MNIQAQYTGNKRWLYIHATAQIMINENIQGHNTIIKSPKRKQTLPLSHYDHELHESPRIDKLWDSRSLAKFMDRIVTF